MKKEDLYYNCHTHRKPQSSGELCIRNAFVTNLTNFNPNYYLSSGVHPWQVLKFNETEVKTKLLNNILNQKNIAIGEIGIDKFHGDIDKQKRLFSLQLDIAAEFYLPVILHQVKAANEIDELLNGFPEPVVLHGFTGHPDIWNQLNKKHKTYVSFGNALFKPSEKLLQSVRSIPIGNTLLETDNSNFCIQEIYQKYCAIKEISIEHLKSEIQSNFTLVFKPKT